MQIQSAHSVKNCVKVNCNSFSSRVKKCNVLNTPFPKYIYSLRWNIVVNVLGSTGEFAGIISCVSVCAGGEQSCSGGFVVVLFIHKLLLM